MTECAQCEYHKERAGLWREAAYKASGYALPDREDMVLVPVADLKDLLSETDLGKIAYALRKMTGESHD